MLPQQSVEGVCDPESPLKPPPRKKNRDAKCESKWPSGPGASDSKGGSKVTNSNSPKGHSWVTFESLSSYIGRDPESHFWVSWIQEGYQGGFL